jgi:hypothetical protein
MFKKIKEIKNKLGVIHFTRWELIRIPGTTIRVYLHKISKADEDLHQHDHPWNFISLILKGGYAEVYGEKARVRRPMSVKYTSSTQPHQVVHLFGITYSLVIAFGNRGEWGYMVNDEWFDHKTYRKLKNKEKNNE